MQSEADSSFSPCDCPPSPELRSPYLCPLSPNYEAVRGSNYCPLSPEIIDLTDDDQVQARSITLEEWTTGNQVASKTHSPPSQKLEIVDLTTGEEISPTDSLLSPKQEPQSESSDESITIIHVRRKKFMTEHLLIDPKKIKYRIFAEKTSDVVTTLGTEENRYHPVQRKLVLYDHTVEKTHCAIRTTPGNSQLKSLTESGIVKVNGEQVKFKSAVSIKDHDIVTIGATDYLYRVFTPRRINRIRPVRNINEYLKEIKKNPNYKVVNITPRK